VLEPTAVKSLDWLGLEGSPPMKGIVFLAVALASLPAAAATQQTELGGKVRSGRR
jgi:hypothetical protein